MNSPEELKQVKKAAGILKEGGIVIYPTDTVFGIGCLAFEPAAVAKIAKIKNRPQSLKMPILISGKEELVKLGCVVSGKASEIIEKYWPGAVTLILPAAIGSVGVRMPNHKTALKLIKEAGGPIIGTSANFHDKEPVGEFKDLDPNLTKLADFVIAGSCNLGKESTIIDCTTDEPKVIRQGAVQIEL